MEDILIALGFQSSWIKVILNIFDFVLKLARATLFFALIFVAIKVLANKVFGKIIGAISNAERQRQFLTLKAILYNSLQCINFAIFVFNLLLLIGIDVRPIVATAGVLGVAVGFGSKRLVEDILSGIMILLEGQIRVGDFVDIEGIQGFVEKVTLPLITVRSSDTGALNFIRCGYIDKIINHTITYSYAFFEFDVAYDCDIDFVNSIIKRAFDILKQNEEYNKLILDEIELFGLDEFKDSALAVKCRIKTQPKGQWIIKRIFNKIVKEEFDKEHIEIPFNQIVVYNK